MGIKLIGQPISLIYPAIHNVSNSVYLDLNTYGIKGDGITDDSIGLQAGINANKGSAIVIPPTPYGYVIRTSLEIPDNTTVIFPRENGKLLIPENHQLKHYEDFVETQDGGIIEAVITNKNHTDGKNVHIIGAYIDGQRNLDIDQAIAGIMLKNCSHSSVKNCVVEGLPYGQEATLENRRRFYDLLLFGAEDCLVENNVLYPVRYENLGVRFGSKRNRILNNICIQDTVELCGHNIQLTSGWEHTLDYLVHSNIVSGNVCINSNHAGIIAHRAARNIVTENVIIEPSAYGLSCLGFSSYENIFSDNYIYKPNRRRDNPGIGISVRTLAERNTFNNNTIIDPIYVGIEIASDHNSFNGNTVINSGEVGLYIIGGRFNNITGLTIKEAQTHGVRIANSKHNKLNGVTVTNSVNHGIYVSDNSSDNELNHCSSLYNGGRGLFMSVVSNNSVNGGKIAFNSEHGVLLNTAKDSHIINLSIHSNGRSADGTFDNMIIDNQSNNNNIQNNMIRVGEETNKPRYGINITATSSGNLVTNNDLLNAGKVNNLIDSGIDTVTTAGNRV